MILFQFQKCKDRDIIEPKSQRKHARPVLRSSSNMWTRIQKSTSTQEMIRHGPKI